jgi:cyclomaltodextrinase
MTQTTVQTPLWVRDAIFYQIFPDRFAKSDSLHKPRNLETWDSPPTSHGFKGGDLIGVVEHLDYLVELGVNAIYFNPVFQSTANHRYHTHDYYNIDPLLGGNDALRVLLDEAHKRGIKVVLDGVFNHASRGFFQFNDILENGPHSPYLDWFRVKAWPLHAYDTHRPPNYDAWWNLHALPKFNTDSQDVREFLLDVAVYWIEFGMDGWRLDVPADIDDDLFWQEFRRRVKAANPEAYIVGEIWEDANRWLQGDQFDAVMNYLFMKLCIEFFVERVSDPRLLEGTTLWPLRRLAGGQFASEINTLLQLYPPEVTAVQLNLINSHDTARFLTIAGGDTSALRLATLFQMVYPGAPCIYYGDEVGLTGGKDPFSRASFPWDESKWDKDLLDFFKRSAAFRHAHPALRSGQYTALYGNDNTYAVARHMEGDRVVAVFNKGELPEEVVIPVGELFPDGATLQDAWHGHEYTIENGALKASIMPRSALLLEG